MKKVMCFGTFDRLHPGHLSYLEQAKKHGDYLIVVVARDQNVKKIKGKSPAQDENVRVKRLRGENIAGKVVLGQIRDRLSIITKFNPDVICLGYDQEADLERIKRVHHGRIVRLKPHKPEVYKSSLMV